MVRDQGGAKYDLSFTDGHIGAYLLEPMNQLTGAALPVRPGQWCKKMPRSASSDEEVTELENGSDVSVQDDNDDLTSSSEMSAVL